MPIEVELLMKCRGESAAFVIEVPVFYAILKNKNDTLISEIRYIV